MHTRLPLMMATLVLAVAAGGCSSMSKGTMAGAGVGGVTGAVLTGGSVGGAAVGAAVGGVVGNELEKKDRGR